jgi:hypothetical protein
MTAPRKTRKTPKQKQQGQISIAERDAKDFCHAHTRLERLYR